MITSLKGPGYGIAYVQVDGQQIASFDGYASTLTYGVQIGPYNLSDQGTHTITLEVSGSKRSASSGYRVSLDNFIIRAPATATPTRTRTFTPTHTRTPTATQTATSTVTSTPVDSSTATSTPSNTPTETQTGTPTDTPTDTATPTAANSFQLIDAAVTRGELTIDQAATYKSYLLFGVGSPTVPEQYVSDVPVPGDGTMLFLDAMKDWDWLSPDTQALINTFITPQEITNTVPLLPSQSPQKQSDSAASSARAPRKLRPGVQKVSGSIIKVMNNTLVLDSAFGRITIQAKSNSILVLNNKSVALGEFRPGDQVLGRLDVDGSGNATIIWLETYRPAGKLRSMTVANDPTSDTPDQRPWSNITDIAGTLAPGEFPVMVADSQNNVYAAWNHYQGSTPPGQGQSGLWYSRLSGNNWLTPQLIPVSDQWSGEVGMAMDKNDVLHAVWGERASPDHPIPHLSYANAKWDGGALTWSNTITLATEISTTSEFSMIDPVAIATTHANGEVQIHVAWVESVNPRNGSGDSGTDQIVYREWKGLDGQQASQATTWLAPTTVFTSPQSIGTIDDVNLAADQNAKLGLAYGYSVRNDRNWIGHVEYQQCDVAAANNQDCTHLPNWSAQTDVAQSSSGFAYSPFMAADRAANLYLVWEDHRSIDNESDIYYSLKPAGSADWSAPQPLTLKDHIPDPHGGVDSFPVTPAVAAGTPNNVYVTWYESILGGESWEVHYSHWDGHQWSAPTVMQASGVYGNFGYPSALVVDNNNSVIWAWQGLYDEIFTSSATQTTIDVGYVDIGSADGLLKPACRMTEYYDTNSNFRIYYTRTFPNVPNDPIENNCSILSPTDLDQMTGYPKAIKELGDALEQSYRTYSTLGYQVGQIHRESSTGRYSVYILSDPAWGCPDGLPYLGICFQEAGGLTEPQRMSFPRSSTNTVPAQQATTALVDPSIPIDWWRGAAAHEFFHSVQYTYFPSYCYVLGIPICDLQDRSWWMEATAVWGSSKVYPLCGWCSNPSSLLNEPYLTWNNNGRNQVRIYGSFILAKYLEEQVQPHSADIVRQTWEQYQTDCQNSITSTMIGAIDGVLHRSEYGTSLANEYPKFARQNYFLNGDGYMEMVDAYTNEFNIWDGQHQVRAPIHETEWQLYRSWLDQAPQSDLANAAVYSDIAHQSTNPLHGPVIYSPGIGAFGAGYLEILPNQLSQGSTLKVTLHAVSVPAVIADSVARFSVLPIVDFRNGPHPDNVFLPAQAEVVNSSQYTFQVANFDQCNRVGIIINAFQGFTYSYDTEILPAPPGTPRPPCTLLPE